MSRLIIGRALWLTVHKYIGLFAGAIFVLIGLTGSILAFGSQIDTWLNAGLISVDVPAEGKRNTGELRRSSRRQKGGSSRRQFGSACPVSPASRRLFQAHLFRAGWKDRSKTYQIFVNPILLP